MAEFNVPFVDITPGPGIYCAAIAQHVRPGDYVALTCETKAYFLVLEIKIDADELTVSEWPFVRSLPEVLRNEIPIVDLAAHEFVVGMSLEWLPWPWIVSGPSSYLNASWRRRLVLHAGTAFCTRSYVKSCRGGFD